MTLGLIIASIYGIFHQLKIYTYLLTTIENMDDFVCYMYSIISTPRLSDSESTVPFNTPNGSFTMTFSDSVEQLNAVLIMMMWSFHWQMSLISIMTNNDLTGNERAIKMHEATALFNAVKNYPVSMWISSEWNSIHHDLEKHTKCFVDRIVPLFVFCCNYDRFLKIEHLISGKVNDLKKQINKTNVSIKTMFISTNSTVFKLSGILFYLSAPFILLPEHGHSTIIWYLIIVLFSGYFFSLRWFIGDVLNDVTETYSNDILSKIFNAQRMSDELFYDKFRHYPRATKFSELHLSFLTSK